GGSAGGRRDLPGERPRVRVDGAVVIRKEWARGVPSTDLIAGVTSALGLSRAESSPVANR
ncbi:MAG: hypothetical protein OXN16_04515, partial [Gammaproteobacteria bacterium]|nr:hypothetical protein [Gammaproteobacteria bacterium]